MSFSSEVKTELCSTPCDALCCSRAELAGILSFAGSPMTAKEGGGLRLRTENEDVAGRVIALVDKLFSKKVAVHAADNKNMFTVYIKNEDGFLHMMKSLGFIVDGRMQFTADPFITSEPCCRRAFLRGAFLGGGSVTSPQKSYHLEIETHYHRLAADLLQLFEDETLKARSVMRKSNHVIYIKESEEIADTLAALGATDSALELYSVKVEKDMKNRINRQINCESANQTKIANTAAIHRKAILRVMQSHLREELTPSMLELAELRLKNPEASLAELALLLSEPLSKSAVSRRLQKIVMLAETLA